MFYILLAAAILLVQYIGRQLFFGPLADIKGPWLAKLTRIPELLAVNRGNFEQWNIELHRKYGPVVCYAPGKFSINTVTAARELYGSRYKFPKSTFYYAFGNPDNVQSDLFTEINPKRHAIKRRKIASLFSTHEVHQYEPVMDRETLKLCSRLEEFSQTGKHFNMPDWMQFYAFDVIGELTLGESFNYLGYGYDHNRILEAIRLTFSYGAHVGVFPELHPIVGGLTQALRLKIPFDIVAKHILHYMNNKRKCDESSFLAKLFNLQEKRNLSHMEIFNTVGSNIAAGSDTISIALSTAFYMLMKNPVSMTKLRKEIDAAAADQPRDEPFSFAQARKLPYLQACIKEALRIHPVTASPFVRVVPSGGAIFDGVYFPAGSIIGVNPWTVHYNNDVYGPDAASFQPERWLQDPSIVTELEKGMLTFGLGSHSCLGKPLAMMQMSKVLSHLVRSFDFELVDKEQAWSTASMWLVKQQYHCSVKIRETQS
ncbi:cytochrome protein [Penicillium frequentans]|nr:cytochrome protein [Penicillium glabrum]